MQLLIYCLCDKHVSVLLAWLRNQNKISKRYYQQIKEYHAWCMTYIDLCSTNRQIKV